jgi:STE24 endopeptidase
MPEKKVDSLTSRDAKSYQAMKNRLFHLGLQAAFCAVLLATGWSRALKVLLLGVRDDFFSLNALYFTAFSLLGALVALPLDFFEGFVWERRFGLSRQTLKGWVADAIKKGAVTFLVGLIFVEGLYFFLSEYPRTWWLGAAGFWFVLTVVMARIFPQVILPLFYKPRPLEAGPLRERLMNFMQGARVSCKDIYVLDFSKKTVKANAMVAGLGPTKRIYLSDTLVSAFSPPEIETVLAHEIGHYRYHDIRNLVGMGLATTLVSFYAAHLVLNDGASRLKLAALSDIAGLPLFFLVVLAMGLFPAGLRRARTGLRLV